MTPEDKARIDAEIARTILKDTPHMSVKEHHLFTVGILSGCYDYVPVLDQRAIIECLQIICEMGLEFDLEAFIASKKVGNQN